MSSGAATTRSDASSTATSSVTGIPDPQVGLVTSLRIAGEGKAPALSTLEATAAAILAEGLASEGELNTAIERLALFTADPHSLIVGPRSFQLWAKR